MCLNYDIIFTLKDIMSSRANASAKQRRVGGATTKDNNFIKEEEQIEPQNRSTRAISVKQALIILNSKINTIERGLDGGNSISTQHGIIQDEVTNDMKILNDTLELHSSNIAALEVKMNNEFSAKIKSLEASIDELKTISMKNQTNTSDLQAMVLKLSTNSKS